MELTMKQARKQANLSQQETADLLEVHRHTYLKWEKNPDCILVGKAKKFASIVNKSVDEIFFEGQSTLSR